MNIKGLIVTAGVNTAGIYAVSRAIPNTPSVSVKNSAMLGGGLALVSQLIARFMVQPAPAPAPAVE